MLPAPDDLDLLIIMGGPMSVNDEVGYPWLVAEKQFIRSAIEKEKAVIGICLGAQLIACAMGDAVYPNREKEIGWFPVTAEPVSDADDRFSFPRELLVLHWHGETFDLPDGAIRLARSAACENQAFQLGRRVIGMQFHLETTPDAARDIVHHCRDELQHNYRSYYPRDNGRDIVHHCRDELQPSRYVQSEAEILGAGDSNYAAINAWMDKVLRFVTDS